MPRSQLHPRWSKQLHTSQPFPDNHVDASFLASLVTNARHARPPRLLAAARAAAPLLQQLSAAALFLALVGLVQSGRARLAHVAAADAAATLLVAAAAAAALREGAAAPSAPAPAARAAAAAAAAAAWRRGAVAARAGGAFAAVLFALSPVLKTLTQSYCNDSIWALTATLCALHVAAHEYRLPPPPPLAALPQAQALAQALPQAVPQAPPQLPLPRRVPGTLSLNAAVVAAVLLASRAASTLRAFAVMALAVQLFALLPLLRDRLRARSEAAHLALTAGFVAAAAAALAAASPGLAAAFLATAGFVAIACPLLLVHASRRYKMELSGAWDIPTIAAAGSSSIG
jgi:phosphatidylinositol glycan class C protein